MELPYLNRIETEYRATFIEGKKPCINSTAESLTEYKRQLHRKRMQIRQAIINHTIQPTYRRKRVGSPGARGSGNLLVIIKRTAEKLLMPLANGSWGKYEW